MKHFASLAFFISRCLYGKKDRYRIGRYSDIFILQGTNLDKLYFKTEYKGTLIEAISKFRDIVLEQINRLEIKNKIYGFVTISSENCG